LESKEYRVGGRYEGHEGPTRTSGSAARYFRIADIHVSLLSRVNTGVPGAFARTRGARCQVSLCARMPLGWWFLLSAEPDIHLLPRAARAVAED